MDITLQPHAATTARTYATTHAVLFTYLPAYAKRGERRRLRAKEKEKQTE